MRDPTVILLMITVFTTYVIAMAREMTRGSFDRGIIVVMAAPSSTMGFVQRYEGGKPLRALR